MKDHELIIRLSALRRQREQRLSEAAMCSQAAFDRAADATRRASEALDAHNAQAANEERAAMDGLLGRSMPARDLLLFRGQSERAAREAVEFQAGIEAARQAEEERRSELAEVRRQHQLHVRAVTKLERLLEHLNKQTIGRRFALAELSDEEESGPRLPSAARR